MLLSLTLALFLVSKAFSGSVSVSTASYPAGWCDLLQGTPTRTTGECICKKDCIGSGCQRAQGFIWFAYETCPTCKCTGVAISNNGVKESKNIGELSICCLRNSIHEIRLYSCHLIFRINTKKRSLITHAVLFNHTFLYCKSIDLI